MRLWIIGKGEGKEYVCLAVVRSCGSVCFDLRVFSTC